MLGHEQLADVEHAVTVGVGVAIEQGEAAGQLDIGHHGVEAGPGVDVAPLQCQTALVVLQQDQADVAGTQAVLAQRAQQENQRVGALGDGDPLALESSTLAMPVSGRVTRAIHSGLE